MSYKLFLDDLRPPPSLEWDVVRSYDEFVEFIKKNGTPEIISFDHDLDDLQQAATEAEGKVYGVRERTGYDCAWWIVENKIPVKKFLVHSMNPGGALRIKNLMNDYLEGKFDDM